MTPRPLRAVMLRSGALLAVIGLGLSACGQPPVSVSAPTPSGASADACQALSRALPDSVRGFSRREIDRASPYVAAWGDDALIVLRCGVTRPEALTATAQVLEVDGVDWLPETFERGTVFTTAGRTAYVEVSVPLELRPEANVLIDLAAAVSSAVPVGEAE